MVDSWLCEEDLPTKPGLRVIRKFDDLYPEDWDQDEFQAYWEFIRNGLMNDYRLLLELPKPEYRDDFIPVELDEFGDDVSPFNTCDFKRLRQNNFDKEKYAVRMVYEKVKDYATTYSSISHRQGKRNTYLRFKALVEDEFIRWARWLRQAMAKTRDPDKKREMRRRFFKIQGRIKRCNEIWEDLAYEP